MFLGLHLWRERGGRPRDSPLVYLLALQRSFILPILQRLCLVKKSVQFLLNFILAARKCVVGAFEILATVRVVVAHRVVIVGVGVVAIFFGLL